MATTIEAANSYIETNIVDIEDWQGADSARKQRILVASEQTLSRKYPDYIVPSNAIFEFANTLATVFNDTNRLQQHGVAGFSVTGVSSFTFKENNVRFPGSNSLEDFIPKIAIQLIEIENDVKLTKRRVGRSVR